MRKILPPPGFDPRTVQPVASRSTDSAIPAYLLPYYYYWEKDYHGCEYYKEFSAMECDISQYFRNLPQSLRIYFLHFQKRDEVLKAVNVGI